MGLWFGGMSFMLLHINTDTALLCAKPLGYNY